MEAPAPWRADLFIHLYRSTKRKHDDVQVSETQTDRRLSVVEYKRLVRGILSMLCSIPMGRTSTRHRFKHSLHHPRSPCKHVDMLLIIDVFPDTATIEVTLFEISDDTHSLAQQIAHAQVTTTTCTAKIEALLQSVFAG